ncbi:hypothetical protein [Haliscomenobacter sp.]|uniref:hypothetical protein n=1 Tax=Haliscomenobacter sp. TaxID=2717303 RepID=UPI00359417AC
MKNLFFLLLLCCSFHLNAQNKTASPKPVEVCDLSLQFSNKEEQELFYGFAAGDKIVFSFSENVGATLAEVEITEFPSNVKFREVNTAAVKEKTLEVSRAAVYRFRFRSDTKKDRTIKVQIKRIPQTEKTRTFATAVRWVEKFDTVYQNNETRFEKQMVKQTRRVLARTDTAIVSLADKTERIAAKASWSGSTSSKVPVTLPSNKYETDRSYEVIAWAYWIGSGDQAEKQYSEANRLATLGKNAVSAAGKLGYLAGPYGALASLALDGVSYFTVPRGGNNIKYRVMNKDAKVLDQGDGPAAYARHNTYTQGTLTFEMANDNYIEAIDARVRIIAVALVKTYRQEEYLEEREVPVARKFEVKVSKVPVLGK